MYIYTYINYCAASHVDREGGRSGENSGAAGGVRHRDPISARLYTRGPHLLCEKQKGEKGEQEPRGARSV